MIRFVTYRKNEMHTSDFTRFNHSLRYGGRPTRITTMLTLAA